MSKKAADVEPYPSRFLRTSEMPEPHRVAFDVSRVVRKIGFWIGPQVRCAECSSVLCPGRHHEDSRGCWELRGLYPVYEGSESCFGAG